MNPVTSDYELSRMTAWKGDQPNFRNRRERRVSSDLSTFLCRRFCRRHINAVACRRPWFQSGNRRAGTASDYAGTWSTGERNVLELYRHLRRYDLRCRM